MRSKTMTVGWHECASPSTKPTDYAPGIIEPGYVPGFISGEPYRFRGNVWPYSGSAYDSARHLVYYWGGGDADYYGNEMYAFDVATQTMQRITEPTKQSDWFIDDVKWAFIDRWTIFADGQPCARHTYHNFIYLPSVDKLFLHGCVGYGPHGVADTLLFNCDPTVRSWTQQDSNAWRAEHL